MKRFIYDVITGKNQGLGALALKPVLYLLSVPYSIGEWLIRSGYDRGILRSQRVNAPVISVGNITAGGVGKTPTVIYLCERILKAGKRPAVLTRGYMPEFETVSDEATMIHEKLPDVQVCPGSDRVQVAREALEDHMIDVFIMDDGFQHRRLERDLDIVLFDAGDPFGNGNLLPAGLLRESLASLKRADVFMITRVDQAPQARLAELRTELNRRNPSAGIVEAEHAPVAIRQLSGGQWSVRPLNTGHKPVLAFCGIASPGHFFRSLSTIGCEPVARREFVDHHVYSQEDIRDLARVCRERGLALMTTEKDAVKVRNFQSLLDGIDLFVLCIGIKVVRGENELDARISRLLSA